MTVSSFFPGHIRLRGEMIKDKDIFEAFKKAASSHKAVSKIERNEKTGSLCIEYDAEALPLSKFEIFSMIIFFFYLARNIGIGKFF